jgi:hypothetical protein
MAQDYNKRPEGDFVALLVCGAICFLAIVGVAAAFSDNLTAAANAYPKKHFQMPVSVTVTYQPASY